MLNKPLNPVKITDLKAKNKVDHRLNLFLHFH